MPCAADCASSRSGSRDSGNKVDAKRAVLLTFARMLPVTCNSLALKRLYWLLAFRACSLSLFPQNGFICAGSLAFVVQSVSHVATID